MCNLKSFGLTLQHQWHLTVLLIFIDYFFFHFTISNQSLGTSRINSRHYSSRIGRNKGLWLLSQCAGEEASTCRWIHVLHCWLRATQHSRMVSSGRSSGGSRKTARRCFSAPQGLQRTCHLSLTYNPLLIREKSTKRWGQAIKWENKMDCPLHTSTFKPTVDLAATLKLLITNSYVCSPHTPSKNGPGCASRDTRKEKHF